jgi:mannosyltransferase
LILLMAEKPKRVDSVFDQVSFSKAGGRYAVRQFAQFCHYLRDCLTSHVTVARMLLVVAIAAGTAVRFYRLDAVSMTADEGAAWAAAAEPVNRLLQLQPQLDSGKLALYDLLLHYWIGIFGDSLRSMRSLSAAIGTVSILLIFAVMRELYRVFADQQWKTGELAGGFAALMFATNVALVQSARTARMYPLMTAAELAQILFFVRAQRHGGVFNYILTAVFLALAIAANFTAVFLVGAESIWVGYLLLARWRRWPGVRLRIAGPALSLGAGFALLLPFAPAALAASRVAVRVGALDWIRYQSPLSWSYDVLRNDAGNKSLFRLFLVLAAFGIWRHRSEAPLAPIFMAAAMAGPFAAVALLGLFGRPMMVERYVLLALIAFLALAATGAAAIGSKLGRILVFLLIVWLSVRAFRHSSGFWVDWKTAVAIACAGSSGQAVIGVVPSYAVSVVRYNLPPERRPLALGLDSQCGNSQILIVNPGGLLSQRSMSELNACYPHLLGRATRVEVRAR